MVKSNHRDILVSEVLMKRILMILLSIVLILNIAMPICASTADSVAVEETVEIFVWAKDIKRGERIVEDCIEIKTVIKENLPINVVTDEEELYTLYANENLYSGEYASVDQLAQSLEKGVTSVLKKSIETSEDDYIVVTDYIYPSTGEDVTSYLQQIIDKNPNRTIYFPDGVYLISSPLFTSADGKTSVSIRLSDGAVIKASKNWKNRGGSSMICLGGAVEKNNITDLGSYYCFVGGTLDGSGLANGLNVVSGRESMIREICIKNTPRGIIIDFGANGGSSDIDFEDITIIGNGLPGTVGIDNKGYDNTYTNIRIYDMETGATGISGEVASIYVINTARSAANIENTVGITGSSRMSNCVTVNCAIAYKLGWSSIIFDCTSKWTTSEYKRQTMFYVDQQTTMFDGCKAYFALGEGVEADMALIKKDNISVTFEGCFTNE